MIRNLPKTSDNTNDFKIKNDELVVEIVRLLEVNEKFEKDVKSLEDSIAHLTKSHDQLQDQLLKDLPTCSTIAINVDLVLLTIFLVKHPFKREC